MRRSHKLIITIWTMLLASPTLIFCVGYARMPCGEMDRCPTGGPMPYVAAALFLALTVTIIEIGVLIMIWRDVRDD